MVVAVDEASGLHKATGEDWVPDFAKSMRNPRMSFASGTVPWEAGAGGPIYHAEHPIEPARYKSPADGERYYEFFSGNPPSDALLPPPVAADWVLPASRLATPAEKQIKWLAPPPRGPRTAKRPAKGAAATPRKKPKVESPADSASDSADTDSEEEEKLDVVSPTTRSGSSPSKPAGRLIPTVAAPPPDYSATLACLPDAGMRAEFDLMDPATKAVVAHSLGLNNVAFNQLSDFLERAQQKTQMTAVNRQVKRMNMERLTMMERVVIAPRLRKLHG